MQESQTFVLRFWVEKQDGVRTWRGLVIHVPSNTQKAGSSIEEVFAIVQAYLENHIQPNKEECP
ncbi:MAG: hypothetical protein D6802_08920 [Ardenticatenia bacterium]|nr:MAG: hypothetical protein D6802_08920 [Ardenticatenia bacterium]